MKQCGAAEVLQVQVQILYCRIYMTRRASGLCNEVSHTHENLTALHIKRSYANINRTDHIDDSVQSTHWPLGYFNEFYINHFQSNFRDWCLRYLL